MTLKIVCTYCQKETFPGNWAGSPPQHDCSPDDLKQEVVRLRNALLQENEESNQSIADLATIVAGFAARIAAQSELLSKRAGASS